MSHMSQCHSCHSLGGSGEPMIIFMMMPLDIWIADPIADSVCAAVDEFFPPCDMLLFGASRCFSLYRVT